MNFIGKIISILSNLYLIYAKTNLLRTTRYNVPSNKILKIVENQLITSCYILCEQSTFCHNIGYEEITENPTKVTCYLLQNIKTNNNINLLLKPTTIKVLIKNCQFDKKCRNQGIT